MASKRKTEKEPSELSKAQMEIMEVVWAHDEISAIDVHLEISKSRTVSPTTIRTMLQRLVKRGWLINRAIGRTFFYKANVSRDKGIGTRVKRFLDDFCGGKPDQLMAALLDERGLSDSELDRIHDLIDDVRKQRKPKRGSE